MPGFRGRGGRGGSRGGSRGGPRGGARGGLRGRSRGASVSGGRLARSGIKTRSGYRKFDSQRVREVDGSDAEDEQSPGSEEDEDSADGLSESSDDADHVTAMAAGPRAYTLLMQSLGQPAESEEPKAKRRKIDEDVRPLDGPFDDEDVSDGQIETMDDPNGAESEEADEELDEEHDDDDSYEVHFATSDDNDLSRRLKAVQARQWTTETQAVGRDATITLSAPSGITSGTVRKLSSSKLSELPLKERLLRNTAEHDMLDSEIERTIAPYVFGYQDLLVGTRTPQNAGGLRDLVCLHATNHVLKGRDRVLKNNERLGRADDSQVLELRDQGFVRPKVLILCETRQMAAQHAESIVRMFQPDQQENKKRFTDSFTEPVVERDTMPEDYRELFDGNNDNSFLTAIKFTRRTLRFYSAFYSSDIIIASPLGLRRVIENEEHKKRDYDFLSSIEVVIVDQLDAMQMQNWENVSLVFKHLNLELREAHGCDFSRVRHWYLDGNAQYLRQTILLSAYITPEMNRLYNTNMLNVAGKGKLTLRYPGAITDVSVFGVKQTFSRFDSPTPLDDPDARFKYFTTAILPRLLRLPKPADGAQGILVFVPSYFDFLRLRNHFATSTQTENVSFGAIHDYSEVSEQRRARSHLMSGRHSILLYTQRAHHFFRPRFRGVKKIVMYGLPDNPTFYQEFVNGFLGTSVNEAKVDPGEASVRCMFSKWDGLKLERIVGAERVKSMFGGVGDTFDFVT